jgi:hypothetical protein
MQNPERAPSRSERRLDQAVPGLIQVIEDFRRAYPQLPLYVIRWVLRQPPESQDGEEPPSEV